MKRFLTILLVLLLATPALSETIFKKSRSGYAVPSATTHADMTLYVDSTGSDTNDCLASGTGACLTIQEAVDRVPKIIKHSTTIEIGAGTFSAVNINGYSTEGDGEFILNGTLGAPTMDGKQTATMDSSSWDFDTHWQECSDADAGWTSSQLQGMLLLSGGNYRVIIDNTATELFVAGDASCVGVYEIVEQKTIVGASGSDVGALGYSPVEVTNIYTTWPDQFEIKNLKNNVSSTMGFVFYNTSGTISQCYSSGAGYWQYVIGQSPRVTRILDCYSTGSLVAGYFAQQPGGITMEDRSIERCVSDGDPRGFHLFQGNTAKVGFIYALNASVAGLQVDAMQTVHVYKSGFMDNQVGVLVDIDYTLDALTSRHPKGSNVWLKDVVIDSNTAEGVVADNGSHIELGETGANVVAGDNGTFGVRLKHGATLSRGAGTQTISGATGDFTINPAETVLTWTTHLGSSGDTVINVDNGCRAWY